MDEGTAKIIFYTKSQRASLSKDSPIEEQTVFVPSDQLDAQLELVEEVKKVRRQCDQIPQVESFVAYEPNPFGEAIDWAYRCYDVTLPSQQDGFLFQRSIYLFNVLVALEWHPDEEYMARLESAFRRASDLLFEITDGWMAFGQVVFGGPELMDCADVQIMASNRLFSRSWVGAMHADKRYPNDEKYMPIRIGRGLWKHNRRASVSWEEPEGYRTLIHEWGHYALTLTDEYLETRRLVFSEKGRRAEATDRILVQAPMTTVVMPTVHSFSDSIMSTTEGTSELVSRQWRKLSERFRKIPSIRVPHQLVRPDRVPVPLPRMRRQGSLAGAPARPAAHLPAWERLRERLTTFALPDDIQLDHCWVYIFQGATPDHPDPARIIAQGTLEARSAMQAFPLLGARAGDAVVLLVALRDHPPVVLRAQIAADGRIEGWTSVSTGIFPTIDVVPQPASPQATLASISVRLEGAGDPAPDRVSVFPLGHTSRIYATRQNVPGKSSWVSRPHDAPTLDAHVLVRWGKTGEQVLISSFSQGGGPSGSSPCPANPIAAGSSDGDLMLFFNKGRDNDNPYGHVKVVTTIAYGLTDAPPGGRERGYAFGIASNQALPAELSPTLVMYYDPFSQQEEALVYGGDIRICRLVHGVWMPLPTYVPLGYSFAVTPLDRETGGTLMANDAGGPRVEYYKVCWVPRGDVTAEVTKRHAQQANTSPKIGSSGIGKIPSSSPTQAEPVMVTLRFEPTKSGAKIYWESIMGEFVSRFTLPYKPQQLPIVIKALDAAQHPDHPTYGPQFSIEEQSLLSGLSLWKDGRVPTDAHRTVGRKLYAALIRDREGERAHTSVREYARIQGKPLSYVLRFVREAIELASLPWECLWDERQAVLLSRGTREIDSCQRYLNMNEALSPPLPIGQKLHILALSPQAGIPPEVRDAERAARLKSWDVLKAKGLLEYDELPSVTMTELDNRMRRGPQPDIIHYYGHGIYKDGSGYLLFDNPELPRQREWVSADRLSAQLGGIRLILIHACQSAMIDEPKNQGGLLTGIAPALSAISEAVVAMQLTVRISAATRFSEVFYEEIARGRSLQAAVAEARRSLYTIESDSASWYVPTLYIRTREQNPVYLVQPEKDPRESGIKGPNHPYDVKPQPVAWSQRRPAVDLPIDEEIAVTAPVSSRVVDSLTPAISVSQSVPHLLHTTPLLIGIVVDVSRTMTLTLRDIPKRAGLSHRAIQDAITDIRNEIVALCRSEQSQEVLPHVSLFLYGIGLSKAKHVVFDRFLRDAGLYSGAPVDAKPVRDLFQDAADRADLPITPTASDLDQYWEEYRRGMEAHMGDILLGGPSALYQGLSVARDRLCSELQTGSFKHALLLVLSDGQLKDGSDTDLLTVSQEIRRLGVDIFSGYIGKRSITRPYTLYGQPGADWPDEAKRLFACSSPLSHENALISTMHRVMQERNWKIQEEARLFVHITQQKMLRDVVDLLKKSIQ